MAVSVGPRILAIDPTTSGFGYAVLEAKGLLDWGVRNVSGDKNAHSLRAVRELIDRYRPEVLALEDHTARQSRRAPRVQKLLIALAALGTERRLRIRRVTSGRRLRVFAATGARTKYATAQALAVRFPELANRLPPVRKPWMSEDYRMGIFDAVALAAVAFDWRSPRQRLSESA